MKKIIEKGLHTIFRLLGLDRSIMYSSSSKFVLAVGGAISSLLIGTFLTRDEQGFYYTFSSVLAIQVFFELGLGGIISQFIAYEMANTTITDSVHLEGEGKNLSRISSILRFCLKWYSAVAGGTLFFLILVGFFFFSEYGLNYPTVKWQGAWIIVVLGTSLNLLISPFISILQGMNRVTEMARLDLIKYSVTVPVSWVILILGANIYLLGIVSMINFVITLYLLISSSYHKLFANIYQIQQCGEFSYFYEILPLQWRIGLSWLSGYFIFHFFTPTVFAFCGAVVAGQMGMTLAVVNSIISFVVAWTSTRVPAWSMYISKKDYESLDQSLIEVIRNSSIVSILLVLFVSTVLFLLNILHFNLSERFLPLWLSLALFMTIPINIIINTLATYLRCHKKEPFLHAALVVGLLSGLSTYIFAKNYGVTYVVIGYVLVVYVVSLPLSLFIFKTKRLQYHE